LKASIASQILTTTDDQPGGTTTFRFLPAMITVFYESTHQSLIHPFWKRILIHLNYAIYQIIVFALIVIRLSYKHRWHLSSLCCAFKRFSQESKGVVLVVRILFRVKLKFLVVKRLIIVFFPFLEKSLEINKGNVNPKYVILFTTQEAWLTHTRTSLVIRPVVQQTPMILKSQV
jgi:hypothetical protein